MKYLGKWLGAFSDELIYALPFVGMIRRLEKQNERLMDANRALATDINGRAEECRIHRTDLAIERNLRSRAEGEAARQRMSKASGIPGLSPAEIERLAMLAEECGEVVQMCGKILRHGFESCSPYRRDQTNREMLERELGDVRAISTWMTDCGDVRLEKLQFSQRRKRAVVPRWTHHQVFSEHRKPAASEPAAD